MRTKSFNKIEQFIISTPRWILRIILLVILALFVMGALRNCQGEDTSPSIDQAPWVIQTYIYTGDSRFPSRFYFGEKFSTIDGIPALNGYWDFDGETYKYHGGIKEFPLEEYGQVDIINRK